ncbi:MAG: hypothetical protein HJJLKODD_01373 [Phycisphaerae bacterium]|nr:hypothetical protein [Phycisphaerae bacterium]
MKQAVRLGANPWSTLRSSMALFLGGVLLFTTGCPDQSGNDNNTNDNTPVSGAPVVNILAPSSDRDLPAGQSISMTYQIDNSPSTAVAFFDIDTDDTNGNETIFDDTLSGGGQLTTTLNTGSLAIGDYYLGIKATNSLGSDVAYAQNSAGQAIVLTVDGLPVPQMTFPSLDIEVLLGSTLNVQFSCNDPENEVSWQLFSDNNALIDGSEVTIGTGSGNTDAGSTVTTVTWITTSGTSLGTYNFGVTCTDSAGSVVSDYASGAVAVVNQLSAPTIQVTQPEDDVFVFSGGTDITIEFEASDPDAEDTSITVFLDDDNTFEQDDGEIQLAVGLPPDATTVTIDSGSIPNSPEGGYYVGAFIEQGGQQNYDYAPGQLTVSGVGDLTISDPTEQVTVTPGTDVTIRWSTNVPTGSGLIDLAVFSSDSDGNKGAAFGDPDDLFGDGTDLTITPKQATLDTSSLTSGFFVVEATLTPVDEDGDPIPGQDPSTALSAPIRVTTLPNIFWVKSIEDEDGLAHFDGVVFTGFQFEDNAGTDLLGAGNLDGLLGDDFIIGSRFAKPVYSNPNGIGIGEAYLVYSSDKINRANRRFDLNSVGLDLQGGDDPNANRLPGMLFFGIRYNPTSEDINDNDKLDGKSGTGTPINDGCFTEDADGDSRLDRYDEDLNGNGTLQTYEDRDLDGHLDIDEDGKLWPDKNCNKIADTPLPTTPFEVDEYINGYLDNELVEDRDGDGVLDTEGDDTHGLTTLGLLPDMDGDSLLELAFGFRDTDSEKPNRPDDHVEPSNFGRMVQHNQFKRGGVVVIPSKDERTIQDSTVAGRFNNERVIELDRAGQEFVGSTDGFTLPVTGVVGNVPPGRPTNGLDPFPLVADASAVTETDNTCDPTTQASIAIVNGTWTTAISQVTYTVTITQDMEQEATTYVTRVIPGTTTLNCVDCEDADAVDVELDSIKLIDPDTGAQLGTIPIPSGSGGDPNSVSIDCTESVVYALLGPNSLGVYDSILSCSGADGAPDNCDIDALGSTYGCDVVQAIDLEADLDSCPDVMVGPFFGFSYYGMTGDEDATLDFESPQYPLAYDEVLSNPDIRAEEFADLVAPGCNNCGRVLLDAGPVSNILGDPPFDQIASGFYPGGPIVSGPVGARILGEAAGDHFGTSISFTDDPEEGAISFVSSPMRSPSDRTNAGAVYQWQMRKYWLSPLDADGAEELDNDGYAIIEDAGGVPKPHQYLMKDLGFSTPELVLNEVEASLYQADAYIGADASDMLGADVVGISDFNGDGKSDVVMGAPGADGANNAVAGSGAVYIIYRRTLSLEGELIDLTDIARDPESDPERLTGMLINGDSGDQMGEVLAGNCDMNDDGADDVVIGIPHADSDRGEVVIVLGSNNPDADYLPSPTEGYSIDALVTLGKAIRIQGVSSGDMAGFNVVCDGDFTGDGEKDLVISTPVATPKYDSNGDDVLDAAGLDLDRDGVNDGTLTNPTQAGLIYVITNTKDLSGVLSLNQMGAALQGFIFVGGAGTSNPSSKKGDQLGGGVETKRSTRSKGLAYAGDIDGDDKDELLISSIFADPNSKTNAGEIYLVFGFDEEDASAILSE